MVAAKFLLAGGANTAFAYLVYVLLVYVGLNYNLALFLDYIVGIVSGYLLNRYWTFGHRKEVPRSFQKYVATYVLVFAGNLVLLNLFVATGLLGPVLGQLLALGLVTAASFLLQNHWVFRHRPPTTPEHS